MQKILTSEKKDIGPNLYSPLEMLFKSLTKNLLATFTTILNIVPNLQSTAAKAPGHRYPRDNFQVKIKHVINNTRKQEWQ